MDGSPGGVVPSKWAEQLNFFSMYEGGENSEDDFKSDYIWFRANEPEASRLESARDDPVIVPDDSPNGKATHMERWAAEFGARRHVQSLRLEASLSRKAAEMQIARAERERDDALDAVEIVSKQLLAASSKKPSFESNGDPNELARVRSELKQVCAERDELRILCDDLKRDAERQASVCAERDELRLACERLGRDREKQRQAESQTNGEDRLLKGCSERRDDAHRSLGRDEHRRHIEDLRSQLDAACVARDDARASAESSRRVIERLSSELVAARRTRVHASQSMWDEVARLKGECEAAQRDRALLRNKLRSSLHALSDNDVAAEFFRREPAALEMINRHCLADSSAHANEAPRAAAKGWNSTIRYGWPPSKHVNGASPSPDHVPVWVTRIAPYYTRTDFDAVRRRCRQFEAELARASHHTEAVTALRTESRVALTPQLRPLAGSDSLL